MPRLRTLLFVWLLAALPAQATEMLRVLAWPGYADADIVQIFEKQQGVNVVITTVDTDDELWQKASANGGNDFDLVAVNTAVLQRLIDKALVSPINLLHVPNAKQQLKRFRDLNKVPGINRDGKTYGIPYTYAEMGLIYNRKLVKSTPTSMAALWDPQYRGKILLYEGSEHNFSLTALLLGMSHPFDLSDTDFRTVVKKLIGLRANRPLFYASPEQAVEQFTKQPVALVFGNYGTQQLKALRDGGADIGYVIPKEGALAWLDCWAILAGNKDSALAGSWINYMISQPVSHQLTVRQGLANTLETSAGNSERDKLVWLEQVEDPDKRAQLWQRILSGYRKGMF